MPRPPLQTCLLLSSSVCKIVDLYVTRSDLAMKSKGALSVAAAVGVAATATVTAIAGASSTATGTATVAAAPERIFLQCYSRFVYYAVFVCSASGYCVCTTILIFRSGIVLQTYSFLLENGNTERQWS